MYERFSDSARKVMALANQEAQRFNQGYIKPEHIFLGLLKEGAGYGAAALQDSGLKLKEIIAEVERLAPRGPEMVVMGKLPHAPEAKIIIEASINYARKLGHSYIKTEHILYALISQEKGIVSEILKNHNLGKEDVIKNLEEILSAEGMNMMSSQQIRKLAENYYMVPKENMDVVEFLQKSGYKAVYVNPNSAPVPDNQSFYEIRKELALVARIPFVDNQVGTPTICYDPVDSNQINKAIVLRQILDNNLVTYQENPTRKDAAEKLRDSVRHVTSLADRLEGK